MRIDSKHIGSQYAFIDKKTGFSSFNQKEIIKYKKTALLNTNSIISILSNGYIHGNNSLIKGVQRVSWMNGETDLYQPNFEDIQLDIRKISEKLESLLINELENYINNYKRIGILLSGGLDSRILVGLLKKIQLKDRDNFNKKVVLYNWGLSNSRDVIYAKKIAKVYKWNYKHFELTPELLKENFESNCTIGCEVSPIHLHAMRKVAEDPECDVVIAGTYGDSIGRGLFSGIHTSNVNEKTNMINNDFGLIKNKVFKESKNIIKEERFNFIKENNIRNNVYEMDQYANYLRRMLATPMSIIQIDKNIFQLFTSPEVFNFMLNLPKVFRTDKIYKHILRNLPENIGSIPYSKDGKDFTVINSLKYDNFSSRSHHYGQWLRKDLSVFIKKNYDMELLYSIGIFNKGSLENLYKLWKKSKNKSNNIVDEKISFLTNLCIYIKTYDIDIETVNSSNNHISIYSNIKNNLYVIIRNIMRD